ncbi:MAG: NYN domain-containing protein [Polaromonas sp.]
MIVFLIDADNLCAPAWIEEAFQKLEQSGGGIAVRRAYGSADKLKGVASVLRVRAIRPFANLSLSKNTTDVALAVDAMELSCQTPIPTTVVIGSGDADFVPLVVRLRERGIRMVCVSEPGKMSPEAIPWYDEIILVGQEQVFGETPLPSVESDGPQELLPALPAKKAVTKKAPAKKEPARKAVAKKAVPSAKKKASDAVINVEVQHILKAVPALETGQSQPLGDVVKLLHDAKLLGKNATSTKLFKKFPHHFELLPSKQPNRVQYILPPSA